MVFYISLRILGWSNSPELEDHDSVVYLLAAEMFRSEGWQAAYRMSPDMTPLFPLLTALVSVFTNDTETAARIVSFSSSIATLVAVYWLAKRLCGTWAGILAIVILSASGGYFFRTSYAVLTEPLYVGLVSWIAVVFIASLRNPRPGHAISLGILCGLAFLTRVEAVLLPFALAVLHLVCCQLNNSPKPYLAIARNYLIVLFLAALVASPQVIRVSSALGDFSLNGRFVRSEIRAIPGEYSHDDRLFGLWFDPEVRNLEYLYEHPETRQKLAQRVEPLDNLQRHLSISRSNIQVLHDTQLVRLVGLPVIVFLVIGLLSLVRAGRHTDTIASAGLLAILLVAPIYHLITLRHLLVIVPLVCALAGIGIIDASRMIARSFGSRHAAAAAVAALGLTAAIALPTLEISKHIRQPDDVNHEYDHDSLQHVARMIEGFALQSGQKPTIMTRKNYVAYFSDSVPEGYPFADLSGLLRYIDGRNIDLLFVEEKFLEDYPFYNDIGSDAWNEHFVTVYVNEDQPENRQALFSLNQ